MYGFQILVVNAVACKLLGYTSEELCAMTLKSLLADPQQIFSLFDVSDQPNFGTGTVVNIIFIIEVDNFVQIHFKSNSYNYFCFSWK